MNYQRKPLNINKVIILRREGDLVLTLLVVGLGMYFMVSALVKSV